MNRALRVPDYLTHIRDAIERIFQYVEDLDEVAFTHTRLVQDAVIRNLEIIGEASRNIERSDPDFVLRHPELQLASARAMRNALSHGDFKVDLDLVWDTVENDLGALHQGVVGALREVNGGTRT